MAGNKSQFSTILGSTFLSIIIIGAGLFFGFPLLEQYQGNSIVVQVKSETWGSEAMKMDYDLTTTKVNDTELEITIGYNHRIHASFTGTIEKSISSDFVGVMNFTIDLVIEGIGSFSTEIKHERYTATNIIEMVTIPIHLEYLSPEIPAGTYNVFLQWTSHRNPSTGTPFIAFSTPWGYETERSLTLYELND